MPPEHAQEVRDELEEHALGLVDRYVLTGHAPQDALRLALADLGSPWQVGLSLNGVHNMPKMIALTAGAALAASTAFYALAGGGTVREMTVALPALSQSPLETKKLCVLDAEAPTRDVVIISREAGKTCYAPSQKALYQGAYIGLNDVQQAYESAGLKTKFKPDGTLYITFPDGQWRVLMPRFTTGGQGYVPAEMLIINTLREPLTPEIKLSGYDNPLLSFGPLKVRLGTQAQPVVGMNFYHQMIGLLVGALTSPKLEQGWSASYGGIDRRFPETDTWPQMTVKTGLKAGEVVMLLTKKDADTYFVDLAPVAQNGSATLYRFPQHHSLKFVNDVRALSPSLSGDEVPALLVKVTGVNLRDLKSGIFLPKS